MPRFARIKNGELQSDVFFFFKTPCFYRLYRTADLKLNEADYSRQIMQLGDAFYDPTSVLVSAEFTVQQNTTALANTICVLFFDHIANGAG